MDSTPVTLQCEKCSWTRAFPDQSKADKGLYNHVYRVHTIGEKEMQRRYKANTLRRSVALAEGATVEPKQRRKYTRKAKVGHNGASNVEPAMLPACPRCAARFYVAKGTV